MANIPGSSPNPYKDPYEDLRVQRVEEERLNKEKRNTPTPPPVKGRPQFVLAFVHLVKKIFSFLFPEEEMELPIHLELEAEDLERLHHFLEQMKKEDLSQDLVFLNQLSLLWHKFIADTFHFKKTSDLYGKIAYFIEEIQTYPENSDHTLGYYLAEYAGSEWLPYPFLRLLQGLYEEHVQDPANSHLEKWTLHLKKLIFLLKEEPSLES